MKKFILFILCCALLFTGILTSCKSANNESVKTKNNNEENGAAESEDAENIDGNSDSDVVDRLSIPDNLPEITFNNYNFRIYTAPAYADKNNAFVVQEEEIGEVINDAIYRANQNVEERFDVTIRAVAIDNVESVMEKCVKSGDDAFDIGFGMDTAMGAGTLKGLYVNLYKVPNLDFSKPWWPKYTVDSLTFDGQMYMWSNSISILGMDWTRVLFINKGLTQELGLSLPYQDVFNNTWTFDKMLDMCKNTYADLNGNGEKDKNDRYGYACGGAFYCGIEPFGIEPLKKDGDTLTIDINNERTVKMVELMYELIHGSPETYYNKSDFTQAIDMFGDNRVLFLFGELGRARSKFRATEIDYGILPYPMLDSEQGQYYSGCTDRLFVIPETAKDLERTGTIVEAMSAEGYKRVAPAYNEIAMKNKYLSDDESSKILDLVYDTRVLGFSFAYSIKFGNMLTHLLCDQATSDFASYYEKNIASVEKAVQNIENKFAAMKDN